ncbi:type II toxin-antitoxin system RnlB family antitoxin [Tissierella praeacuta]|uniref:type II toxin-antitoxin system RnlB family antitoxin n=1 Tax=Tissierella praeacuta TaxID=43131 RepID=UPI001C0FA386|nr:type II toxin-antitoxin system RnlB family antitoxin [Tissierella praeacuta]MBU5256810.1 type II toxin-antitoxin system RnlB family antitoxin [Tissierella praeacuta]
MKLFSIYPVQNEIYSCIVFINTHITPFEVIDEISSELKNICIDSSKILFDLLLYRGNSSKRYFEAKFINGKFESGSFRPVDISKRSNIRKISTCYFKDNFCLLKYSMLTEPQIQLISKGLVI